MTAGLRATLVAALRNSRRGLPAAVVLSLCVSSLSAQGATEAWVMSAVRAALAPALPFPDSDASGATPADGKAEPLWMVRPPAPGEQSIEVLANPLNQVNQLRATRAMAQIQDNIESAERRAAAQYDRAVAEAKRTGKSQDVDGITLGDEGVAGAKIDADSHVTIDVAFNQSSYEFNVASSVQPAPPRQVSIPGLAAVITVPSNTFRDERMKAERYAEAETLVFLGPTAAPEVRRLADNVYEVTAAVPPLPNATPPPIATLVLRLRGNEGLITDLLRKTDWGRLLELLK